MWPRALVPKTEETRKWPWRPYNVKVSIITARTNDSRARITRVAPNSKAARAHMRENVREPFVSRAGEIYF